MSRSPKTEPATVGALLAGSRLARGGDRVDRDTWARAVGDRVAGRTEPLGLQKGTLTVRVVSSVWAQELSLLGPTIVGRLRADGRPVSSLRFVVGDVSPPTAGGSRRLHPRAARPLSEEFRRRLATIDDADLRRAIEQAASYATSDGDDEVSE